MIRLFDEMYDREDGVSEPEADAGDVAALLRSIDDGPADDVLDGVAVAKFKYGEGRSMS